MTKNIKAAIGIPLMIIITLITFYFIGHEYGHEISILCLIANSAVFYG